MTHTPDRLRAGVWISDTTGLDPLDDAQVYRIFADFDPDTTIRGLGPIVSVGIPDAATFCVKRTDGQEHRWHRQEECPPTTAHVALYVERVDGRDVILDVLVGLDWITVLGDMVAESENAADAERNENGDTPLARARYDLAWTLGEFLTLARAARADDIPVPGEPGSSWTDQHGRTWKAFALTGEQATDALLWAA